MAAFIAGMAGMVGALGGALVGGVAAVRGARIGAEKAAEAVRQQVQDQASVDHDHWLRQQRLEAYTMLLGAYDAHAPVAHRASQKVADVSPGEDLPDAEFEEMFTTAGVIQQERQRVKLVGPDAIHVKAVELEQAVWRYRSALMALAEALHDANPLAVGLVEEAREARRNSALAHDSFVRAVGSLLGERGT
ncbi:hypothetical protein [Streptomyces marianii]|uniref:Uncharacterized protein n=1 Tax=Streptomyces marianii TaxID=1817406 RepID=A0A5R9E5Z0_9ACTN|nr:hypothetical protein [Streptomyces marianii]TLQ43423.1 hypothetical protein FEF34_09960 [Streptomyces marianii]